MGENLFKPEHRRYSETLLWIFHWNHTTETTDFIALSSYGDQAFKIDFCISIKCEEIAEHTLNAINKKFACDKCQSYGWQINETLCTSHVKYSELATKIDINLLRPSDAYICVGNQIIIGSDNGLSSGRRQAIFWTNAGTLLIGPLGTNFSEILIDIDTFSLKKMHLKMSSGKWRLFGLGLNVLIQISYA